MKTLKNQTIYQCEHCNRRLLSKNGAILHENHYCKRAESPNQKNVRSKQVSCKHERTEVEYSYIRGEAAQEPSHYLCLDCGKVM